MKLDASADREVYEPPQKEILINTMYIHNRHTRQMFAVSSDGEYLFLNEQRPVETYALKSDRELVFRTTPNHHGGEIGRLDIISRQRTD